VQVAMTAVVPGFKFNTNKRAGPHVRALDFIFGVFITRRDNIIMLLRFLAAGKRGTTMMYPPETAKPHR